MSTNSTTAGQGLPANTSLPLVGTLLTVAAGLSFFFVCMILPLVGKAGVQTVHASQNFRAFLVALIVSLAFSVAATVAKMKRSRLDGSPKPYLTMGLFVINMGLLISLFAGLLKI
ncbi:MAG: hypothetical protein M5U15_02215 [Kiritimatiellae bacterium]|nr:hypothetical protein [Kiritimatiellia bacterium]